MPMSRNQTKVGTEARLRGPGPCSALFSGRADAVVGGGGAAVLQLGVGGLAGARLTIIEKLAYTDKVAAMLLPEAHC